ncbi:MAG: hypothetical protein KC501_22890 [Myxococcales bacterium]|nr:hypothetical protein [Myxococcales bacterium]
MAWTREWMSRGLLGVALVLAGCSDDEASGSDPGSGSAGSTAPAGLDGETGESIGTSTTEPGSGSGPGSTTSTTSAGSTDDDAGTSTSDDPSTTGAQGECSVSVSMACSLVEPPVPDATIDALAAEPHPGLGFIPDPPGGGPGSECDLYFQDCAPDEKCLPWSNDGGDQLNGTRCNPVPPMPDLLGDSCTSEAGGLAGIDSCDHGLICWEGACQELCGCSEAHPVCSNPATACVVSHDGWVPLCEPLCNPLDPLACAVGEGCYPLEGLFFCAPDASAGGGGPGDPCTNANSCDPGTVCVEGSLVPGCLGDACCTPLCSAGGGGVVCLPGQVCVPWYEDGAEPDNCLGKVRVCIDP